MLSMTSFFNPQRDQSRLTLGANQLLVSMEERGRDPMPIPILDHVTGGVRFLYHRKGGDRSHVPVCRCTSVRQRKTAVGMTTSGFVGRSDKGPLYQDRRPNSRREGSPSDLFHATGSDTGNRHGCGLLPNARCDIQGAPVTAKSPRPESLPTTPVNLTQLVEPDPRVLGISIDASWATFPNNPDTTSTKHPGVGGEGRGSSCHSSTN